MAIVFGGDDLPLSIDINWGDGSPSECAVLEPDAGYVRVTGSHTYALYGIYRPALTLSTTPNEPFRTTVTVGSFQERWASRVFRAALGSLAAKSHVEQCVCTSADGATNKDLVASLVSHPDYRRASAGRIFRALLDRDATKSELESMTAVDPMALRTKLLGSDEYFGSRASGTPDGFISAIFRDVTRRPPTAGERAAWAHELATNARHAVARRFLESLSARLAIGRDLYEQLSGSVPTAAILSDAARRLAESDGEMAVASTALLSASLVTADLALGGGDEQAAVFNPDIVFQCAVSFDTLPLYFSSPQPPDIRGLLTQAMTSTLDWLRGARPGVWMNPQFRTIAFDGRECSGIWAEGGLWESAQDGLLAALDIVPEGKLFALQLPPTIISGVVQALWDHLLQDPPEHMHFHGQPRVTLDAVAKRLGISGNGTYHYDAQGIGVDVDFSFTYMNTFSLDGNGFLACLSQRKVDVDTSGIDALKAGAWLGLPIPFADMIEDAIDEKLLNAQGRGLSGFSVGADLVTVVRSMSDILIPGQDRKIAFAFDDLQVDEQMGVFIAGGLVPVVVPRSRVCRIGGPQYLAYPAQTPDAKLTSDGYVGTYGVVTTDMRPPLTVHWNPAGSPIAGTTKTKISIPVDPVDGANVPIFAKVTDVDGFTASGKTMVVVTIAPESTSTPSGPKTRLEP